MKITAKQIARQLNLSEAAVSMALRQKPGVSTQTRKKVIETAQSLGYDFSKINPYCNKSETIHFIFYNKHRIFESPFFTELVSGVENGFKDTGYRLMIDHIHAADDVKEQLDSIISAGCDGIILLGTEMSNEDFSPFSSLNIPVVLLDSYINSPKTDCVIINNIEGAMLATNYLIKKCYSQPGYLHSVSQISNFNERSEGFYKAIRQNGFSISNSIVHLLSASIDGAYSDMLSIIKQGEPLAKCYFADNDDIAIGAMRAFKEMGYRIPEDISVAGFDNIPFSAFVDPPLTTIHVPKSYMGNLAAERMMSIINQKEFHSIKIEVNTSLVIRKSVI